MRDGGLFAKPDDKDDSFSVPLHHIFADSHINWTHLYPKPMSKLKGKLVWL